MEWWLSRESKRSVGRANGGGAAQSGSVKRADEVADSLLKSPAMGLCAHFTGMARDSEFLTRILALFIR
ncbi:MAG: hypothetical protein AABZ55_14745 [Bdellovibrionota bacterium]